jgi:GNAT superfamily N-acetyltransferase
MTVSVRRACYDADEQELIDVLQTNLPYRPHARFFNWLYRENPAGEAMAWVAIDPNTNRIVGAAAAFPRLVYCGGIKARGYLLGDFCVHPAHRSLGLALALQRACLDGLSAGDADFVFDFPSHGMLAVYNRLRIPVNETVVRYVKPLRADRQVENRVPVRAIARGFASVINAGLRLRDKTIRRSDDWSTACEAGPWGAEFTEAIWKWSPAATITIARTAEYLNWRYRGHPQQQYEMLTARRNGKLYGYLVRHVAGNTCVIDDLLAENDSVCKVLLLEAIGLGRRDGAHTITLPWPFKDPGQRLLKKYGFRPRESSPAVLLPFPRPNRCQDGPANAGWHLPHADWEV